MKLTRREMVVAATGSAVAMNALAQSAQQASVPTVADFAKQAQDSVQRNRDSLAKIEIPMSTEPAFQFKA